MEIKLQFNYLACCGFVLAGLKSILWQANRTKLKIHSFLLAFFGIIQLSISVLPPV